MVTFKTFLRFLLDFSNFRYDNGIMVIFVLVCFLFEIPYFF